MDKNPTKEKIKEMLWNKIYSHQGEIYTDIKDTLDWHLDHSIIPVIETLLSYEYKER